MRHEGVVDSGCACRSAWQHAFATRTVCTALASAAVAGSLLNLVNQGAAFVTTGRIDWWRFALTYCVPYAVATFGAVRAGARRSQCACTSR